MESCHFWDSRRALKVMKWWCRGCQCSQYQPLTRNIHFKMVGNQLDGLNQTFTTKRCFFHQTSIKNWLFGVPAPPISLFLYHLTASEKKVLLYYPNNSCLIYLPTFTIKINQIKCRYTIHGMGYISQMGRCFKIMQKGLKIVFHHSENKESGFIFGVFNQEKVPDSSDTGINTTLFF